MAKVSRRGSMVAALMSGLGAEPATAAPAVSALPGTPADAALTDLARQLLEIVVEEERLLAPYYRLVRFTRPPDVAARLDALTRQHVLLRQQMAALSALTLPGLRAKALVMMLWLAPDGVSPIDAGDVDARLAWSLCKDLLDGVEARDIRCVADPRKFARGRGACRPPMASDLPGSGR